MNRDNKIINLNSYRSQPADKIEAPLMHNRYSFKEWGKALWLFLLLYIVLAFADFGTGFQYVGF